MVRDLALLCRLHMRDLRGRVYYWAALAGADLETGSLMERTYAFYVGVLLAASFAVMMAGASEAARVAGSAGGPELLEALQWLGACGPAALALVLGVRALRSAPVKLTFPDIAYVAASALDTRAVAVAAWLREALSAVTLAAPLGCLLGSVAHGTGYPAYSPMGAAVVVVLAVVGAHGFAWALGMARVRLRPVPRPALVAVAVAAAALSLPVTPLSAGAVLGDALSGGAAPVQVLALGASAVLAAATLLLASTGTDMTVVIGESALYAQLRAFHMLRLCDPAAYADIVRRQRSRPSPSAGG